MIFGISAYHSSGLVSMSTLWFGASQDYRQGGAWAFRTQYVLRTLFRCLRDMDMVVSLEKVFIFILIMLTSGDINVSPQKAPEIRRRESRHGRESEVT